MSNEKANIAGIAESTGVSEAEVEVTLDALGLKEKVADEGQMAPSKNRVRSSVRAGDLPVPR